MNKNLLYIGAIVSLLSLFTRCDMPHLEPEQRSGKAAVRVQIGTANTQARTVSPTVALEDVSAWELRGGKQGDTETLLAEFASAQGTSISLETGTWSFTLKGYKDGALILSGTIAEQAISLDAANVLVFTVAPALEETGSISIVINLPADSGISSARVFRDGTELSLSLTPADNQITFSETAYTAGDYYFSIRLYKGEDLYGVVSELVQVRANLESAKTYTLTQEDLKYVYVITYHKWEGETETGYYRYTDATVTLPEPSREDYVFKGWYADENLSGSRLTQIPSGSTGDKDFYAKWALVRVPAELNLAESLEWISANVEEGGNYTITVNTDEALAPKTLSYSGKHVGITLIGNSTERMIRLSANGNLFTVESGVTLTLANNITLQGRGDNSSSLVQVNSSGTLVMENGSKITGNTYSSSYNDAYGGGVYVNSGTFTMNGGEISGNSAAIDYYPSSSGGGGVFVSNGTFTMNGGEISSNTASRSSWSCRSYGGGVYVSSGTFTMNGGEISSNTAVSYSSSGGGVYMSNGTFTMNGGEISGNSAAAEAGDSYYSPGGGGVYMSSGTFTMNGGEISGNSAAGSSSGGGGVYVYSNGTFTKESGGTIYGSNAEDALKNTAGSGNAYGHGVYVDSSKKRNTTAGAGLTLDSSLDGAAGGWVDQYTVTFDADGGSPATQTMTVDSSTISNIQYSSVSGGEWTIQSDERLLSPAIAHNGVTKARLSFTSVESNTSISIQLDVSSEANFDYAFISNLDSSSATATSDYYRRISGEESVTLSIPVSNAGNHFIEIGYQKDGAGSSGSDCAWFKVISGGSGGSAAPSEPARSGYTFSGWYTQQNGGGAQFVIATASTTVRADRTVYAKWLPDTSVQISLRPAWEELPISNTNLFVSESAQFSAGGGYQGYTWYWDGAAIAGETSSTYTLGPMQDQPEPMNCR